MQGTPPPSRYSPLPPTPPAQVLRASEEIARRFRGETILHVYEGAEKVLDVVKPIAETIVDGGQLKQELESETQRLADEQRMPVIDRRRDERGRSDRRSR